MITENIFLRATLKKKLKHLSIDNGIYVSTMLINSAQELINSNTQLIRVDIGANEICEHFTMKIDEDLKIQIKDMCKKNDVRIKDFWNEAAILAIDNMTVNTNE